MFTFIVTCNFKRIILKFYLLFRFYLLFLHLKKKSLYVKITVEFNDTT